jgi:hypothetical protein
MKFFKDAMAGQVADGFILKPNYLKKQRFSSSFLLTCSRYTGSN